MSRDSVEGDRELVIRAIAGDTAAFGELVGRYERTLRALAYQVVRDVHLAEDVVQDALVAGFRQLGGLRNRQAFGAWMMQIVRRRAHLAASRRVQMAGLSLAAGMPAPEENLDVDSERLLAAIMRLSEEERMVLMLRHFDGHDTPVIAQMTGEHIGTVTKRLSRAHAHLRQRLQECPR